MKTDLYTKIILTIIAVALIGNIVKDIDFVGKSYAAPLPLEALNTQTDGVIDVNIVQINGKSLISDEIPIRTYSPNSINVKVTNKDHLEKIPVHIIVDRYQSNIPVTVQNSITIKD